MSGIFTDVALLRSRPSGASDAADRVPVTVIQPDGSARGGIVVLHESRKFTDSLLDLMRALANEGWIAVAPNLFHRQPEGSEAEVFGDSLFEDFDAVFDWLTARGVLPDTVGVIGFDDAGTAAFMVATNRPIGAAVSVAARGIVKPLAHNTEALVDAAPSLQAPWLGLYGSDDPRVSAAEVEELKDAVATASVAANVVVYSGIQHRADEPSQSDAATEEFDAFGEVVIDAQKRIFDWFDSNLR